jgi:hypothetical protein
MFGLGRRKHVLDNANVESDIQDLKKRIGLLECGVHKYYFSHINPEINSVRLVSFKCKKCGHTLLTTSDRLSPMACKAMDGMTREDIISKPR